MIKFFRRIRYQLLGEGKTGKYLKYAIGEIVLVMIGILLALQVNNWNEERKLLIEEQEILLKLQTEFQLNNVQLDFYIKQQKLVAIRLRRLLNHFGQESVHITDDSLVSYMSAASYIPRYIPKQGALSSIISSGKIVLINNDVLNVKLTNWPGELANYNYDQEIVYDISKKQIMDYISDNFPFREVRVNTEMGDTGGSKFSYNKNSILKSMAFETFVEFKRIDTEGSYITLKKLKILQDEILELIKQELND